MESNNETAVAEVIPAEQNQNEIISVPESSLKFDAETLIAKAIDNNVPVETMERLLAMRRDLKAEWAKEQFDKALSAFQGECPVIGKNKLVDFSSKRTGGNTRYKYAPLDSIISQVKSLLTKYGFSYTFDTQVENMHTINLCKVTHKDGHSETGKFEVPIDQGAFMNEQQKFGSANTFGKRYAFLNAFGILTGDEDDDSNLNPPQQNNQQANTRPVQNKPKQNFSAASEAQRRKIKDLKEIKNYTSEEICKALNIPVVKGGQLDRSVASQIITWLTAQPIKPKRLQSVNPDDVREHAQKVDNGQA